jgi:hypothetical protein
MTSKFQPAATTVVCHVRPSLVLDPVDSKVETLRNCEEEGTIESLLLRSWPPEVTLTADGTHHEVVERFRRFEAWAADNEVSIEPPFRTRTSTSIATDEQTERLLTPGICLALYRGEQLRCVVPHVDGETTYTVPETIAALRTGSTPDALDSVSAPERSEPVAAKSGRDPGSADSNAPDTAASQQQCPACGVTLANVQGMMACVECEWLPTEEPTPLARQ